LPQSWQDIEFSGKLKDPEQQQVRVYNAATEEQVDPDRVAETRDKQGNRGQGKSAKSSSPSVWLSTSKNLKSLQYVAPARATSVIGSQPTAAAKGWWSTGY